MSAMGTVRKVSARALLSVRRLMGQRVRYPLFYMAATGRRWQPSSTEGDMRLVRYDAAELDAYKRIQSIKSEAQANRIWFIEQNLRAVGQAIRSLVPRPSFGICHGAKHGRECAILAEETGARVIGTDISAHVATLPNMVVWDFHEPNPDWTGRADFIYSNSWDHAHDPKRAFSTWADTLKPGGVLVLEHSDEHLPDKTDPVDVFGATSDALRRTVLSIGRLEFLSATPLPDAQLDNVMLVFRKPGPKTIIRP